MTQYCSLTQYCSRTVPALEAARIMRGYAKNKAPRERTASDFLIGAHAIRQADALLTTDAGFFRDYFEGLSVLVPAGE